MKALAFETKEQYELLYEAMSTSETGYRGRDIVLVSRIFDKLEKIGKKKEDRGYTIDGVANPDNFEATGTGPSIFYPSISLEDEEYNLVIRAFDSVPWTAAGARVAAKVYDWLHSIK